ncbi:MAG: histidine kinase [Chitinophagaceae bacterium]
MKHWEVFRRYKLHHILLWSLFFAGWYLFRAGDFPNQQVAIYITTVKVLILASLVYFTNYALIPGMLYKKQYGRFALVYTCMILALGFFKVYLIIKLLQPYYSIKLEVFDDFKARFYDNIIPLFLLVSTGAAAKLVMSYIIFQQRLAAISQEKAETELQYLKSQINPHFVFNTLNTLYFQINKTNHEARETLLEFSGLLRYQLYECNAEKIAIEKEMAYLKDYIHLQQKRKDENYIVNFNCSQALQHFQIVPLLLSPFVENAFKHISHFADKPNTICINAGKRENTFNFSVINTTENGQQSNEPQVGGIGLKNVQRRLDLLYNGKHTLEILKEENAFKVNLIIMI